MQDLPAQGTGENGERYCQTTFMKERDLGSRFRSKICRIAYANKSARAAVGQSVGEGRKCVDDLPFSPLFHERQLPHRKKANSVSQTAERQAILKTTSHRKPAGKPSQLS